MFLRRLTAWVAAFVVVAGVIPAMALADDPNLSAVTVSNISNDAAGASASYTVTLSLSSGHAIGVDTNDVTLFFATEEATTPDDSGYSFENASLPVYTGFDLDSVAITQLNEAFTLTINPESATLFSWTLGLSNVTNSADAGCYVLMATSENPGPIANYTISDPFSIGDATCAGEEGDDNGGEEESTDPPTRITKPEVRFKQKKKKSVSVRWASYSDDTAQRYQVQYRKCKNDTKNMCKKKKHYVKRSKWKRKNTTTQRKKLKRLKSGTYYQVRVRAYNDNGWSRYSKWKRFKTKGTQS